MVSVTTHSLTAQHLLGHGVSLTRQRYAMHRTAQTHRQGATHHAHTERTVPRHPMTSMGRNPWSARGSVDPAIPVTEVGSFGVWHTNVDAPEGFALRWQGGPESRWRATSLSILRRSIRGCQQHTHARTRTRQRHPPTSQTDG